MGLLGAALRIKQLLSPATPEAGSNALYPKADNKWYSKDSTGAETLVGPGLSQTFTDARYVNVDGDTVTGSLSINGSTNASWLEVGDGANFNLSTILNVRDPGSDYEPANKRYVDTHAGASGVKTIPPVRLAALVNVPISSGLISVDGVVTVSGDRVLLPQQTDKKTNGVYIVQNGLWQRAQDANEMAEVQRGTCVYVTEGTQNKFKTYQQTQPLTGAVGTEDMAWRVVTHTDLSNVFDFPTPQGSGHLFYNQNQKVLAVWDGGQWVNLDSTLICTSTTRPEFYSDGYTIYETDTGLTFIAQGGSWQPVGTVEVMKDGSTVVGSVSGIDFRGAGVSVSAAGPDVLVNIPGGGGDPITLVPTTQVFTPAGTYTNGWTKPANTVYVEVEMVGGGGGGGGAATAATNQGSAGAGGGGGGYCRKTYLAADLSATETVVVGAGGTAGAANAGDAGNGTASTFKGMSAGGGNGGQGMVSAGTAQAPPGSAGGASGGDLNIAGSDGEKGLVQVVAGGASVIDPTMGGASQLGGSIRVSGVGSGTGDGINGRTYGGGAGGGYNRTGNTAAPGGTGAAGVVIVTSYINTTVSAVPGMQVVSHGTDANVARPVGVPVVYWVGSATPVNGLPYDLWKNA